MKSLKTIIFCAIIIMLTGTLNLFALEISGSIPEVDSPHQTAVNAAWHDLVKELNGPGGQLENISRPNKLNKGFAEAATYTNFAATQRGYMNYNLFALTFGAMAGAKLPGSNKSDFLDNMGDNLEEDGDIDLGVNAQFAIQAGVNCSFLVNGLYLALKLGMGKISQRFDDDEFKFDLFTIGLLANYRLIDEGSIGFGGLKWRGISLGSGLVYQQNMVKYNMDIDSVDTSFTGGKLEVDPDFEFEIKTQTLTVPLELTTALRLFWLLNIHAGVGADLQVIGKSDMKLALSGAVEASGTGVNQTKSGSITAREKLNDKAKIIRPKIMAGLGVGIGDYLILDVPVTYYIKDGINIGVSLGTVW